MSQVLLKVSSLLKGEFFFATVWLKGFFPVGKLFTCNFFLLGDHALGL